MKETMNENEMGDWNRKIQTTLVQTHVQYNFVTSSEQMGLIKKN